MHIGEILNGINHSVQALLENDKDTLMRGLNERIISGRLATYLQAAFNDYNVDPEYNGDIDKPNDRKALSIARDRMLAIGLEPNDDNSYSVNPDIIVHRRGTNDHNLIVIEVKKDSSLSKYQKFDLIKLEHLTIDYLGNHYNYRLGVAVTFGTGKNAGLVDKVLFQKGIPTPETNLT